MTSSSSSWRCVSCDRHIEAIRRRAVVMAYGSSMPGSMRWRLPHLDQRFLDQILGGRLVLHTRENDPPQHRQHCRNLGVGLRSLAEPHRAPHHS